MGVTITDFDRGASALDKLVADADVEPDKNEAATRLKFIDRLLMECLDWDVHHIAPEEHQDGDYLDYVLGRPERAAVLEAKRTSVHFEVPAGVLGERYVRLRSIYNHSTVNKQAIDQVLRYSHGGGIPVAALCNGHQLVLFLASRQDGVAPLDGKAMLFSSLSEMATDFSLLWEAFSRSGVKAGWLRRRLSHQGTLPPPPERLSSRIVDYPGFRPSTDLDRDMQLLADLFLQDIMHEESVSDDFLRDCYCPSGALSQYAVVSRGVLASRKNASTGVDSEPAVSKHGDSSRLASIIGVALQRRPLVLLGNVGVGKSIFLKHFFRIDASDVLDRTLVFFLDFLKDDNLLLDFQATMVRAVTNELRDVHGIDIYEERFVRATYNKEINRFKRGLFGKLQEDDPSEYAREERRMLVGLSEDRQEHLRRSLEQLRGTRQLDFVLVLDNVDHHTREDQEKIFVLGDSLAHTWPFVVFLSLRPDTFYTSRREGSLAAYQPRVFTIEPPRTDLVIAKRLEFARSQLVSTGRLESFPAGLSVDSASLLAYIDVLLTGFRENESLKEMVDNLSSGNVRQALDFLSRFVGSGYFSTGRVLDVAARGEIFTLPVHEFLRAILLGSHAHYDPTSSAIANVFDTTTNDGREHFALLIILASCESRGEATPDGFVEEVRIFEEMQELGFAVSQIETQLERGLNRQLLEATPGERALRSLRVTTAGAYMHKRLASTFTYVDAMIDDTPVVLSEYRKKVHDVKSITDRLSRAEVFADYLDSCWSFSDDSTTFSWPSASASLRRDIEQTSERAARNLARRLS